MPSKKLRRLVIDRCTFKGKGLLELVDFSAEFPCTIALKQTAVQADALLCWRPARAFIPLTHDALHWSGAGNQYDIHGESWVVLEPEGYPALDTGPTDLKSWTSFAGETDALLPPVRFSHAATPAGRPQGPADFAIDGPDRRPVGADPGLVGPAAGSG